MGRKSCTRSPSTNFLSLCWTQGKFPKTFRVITPARIVFAGGWRCTRIDALTDSSHNKHMITTFRTLDHIIFGGCTHDCTVSICSPIRVEATTTTWSSNAQPGSKQIVQYNPTVEEPSVNKKCGEHGGELRVGVDRDLRYHTWPDMFYRAGYLNKRC